MSSSMCRATLLPEPDSPLTMINRIDMRAPGSTRRAGLDHVHGVVVRGFFLVFLDASVKFVGEGVDGGVHVIFGGVRVDLVSPEHEGGFGLVAEFFDREHAVNVDELIEVPRDALELLENVSA